MKKETLDEIFGEYPSDENRKTDEIESVLAQTTGRVIRMMEESDTTSEYILSNMSDDFGRDTMLMSLLTEYGEIDEFTIKELAQISQLCGCTVSISFNKKYDEVFAKDGKWYFCYRGGRIWGPFDTIEDAGIRLEVHKKVMRRELNLVPSKQWKNSSEHSDCTCTDYLPWMCLCCGRCPKHYKDD